MKKVKFIAFSDLHLNQWNLSYEYSGDRLRDGINALNTIIDKARQHKVPMLFSGDFCHRPKSLDSEVIEAISMVYLGQKVIGIDGNHDQRKTNTHKNPSPGYFSFISRMKESMYCVNYTFMHYDGTLIHGIPYMKHNVGFKTYLRRAHQTRLKHPQYKHVLLIHTDLPGVVTENGMVMEKVENIKSLKVFKGFDLVLCGHIHKPQILSSKIINVGAPYQQNIGEMGQERGYWEIYEDFTCQFIPLTNIPTYKRYNPKKGPGDLSKHIWVPHIEAAAEVGGEVLSKFDIKQSRKSIADYYLKVNEQKSKRKRKLLISLINKTT